ncbi:unnamed protein product [Amoebophrya sp. A25]|nr:unnamed protein product [Amoebophrya sp. A25]|eukprot:GSA25T00023063001.1
MPRRTLLVSLLLVASANAFDRDGHEAIGMTANSAIPRGKVLHTLKRLLQGKDIMDVSGWAHMVDNKLPWTEALHYQKYELGTGSNYEEQCQSLKLLSDANNCPSGHCLIGALGYFFSIIAKNDKETPSVKLELPAGQTFTEADAMKFLVNLVADAHQPMHFVPSTGPLGTSSVVTKTSDLPTMKKKLKMKAIPKTNLYEFWDKDLTQNIKEGAPSWWDGGWTNIYRGRAFGIEFDAQQVFEREDKELKSKAVLPYALFERWATETAKYACLSAYRDGTNLFQAGDDETEVSEKSYNAWKDKILENMLAAGARTAITVNAIVEAVGDSLETSAQAVNPDGKVGAGAGATFNTASGVAEVTSDEEDLDLFHGVGDLNLKRGRHAHAGREAFQNFCINLLIFIVELGMMMFFFHYTGSNAAAATATALGGTYNLGPNKNEPPGIQMGAIKRLD